MSDMNDLRARLNAIGEAFVLKEKSVIARTIAEAMAELELAREAKLCLIDLVLECNPRKGEYAIPSRELIDWAHRIIRRGYRKESDA
jgi:hypothetical protein